MVGLNKMHAWISKAPPWIIVALAFIAIVYLSSDWTQRREAIESLSRIAAGQQHIVETLSRAFDEHITRDRVEMDDMEKRLREVEKRIGILDDRWDHMGYEMPVEPGESG